MKCSYDTCGRNAVAGGTLCRSHYRRRASGDIDKPIRVDRYVDECLVDGCQSVAEVNMMCRTHNASFKRTGKVPVHRNSSTSKWITSAGYVVLGARHKDNPNQGVRTYEHVAVMEKKLGRRLQKGENVHHLNGQRSDNRVENLELWSTSQPSGQRVLDKVAWAKEILRMYAGVES